CARNLGVIIIYFDYW
nr:immunoglobulin heavy chain junction region [Macaca mulatta]MOW23175.1 immunoglobulin heavy chain junction region [Macaca mulatta]MOW23339.1 immunoglobulin heavy chain junction region [Macaca mulatta]MOW23370.1 immunoglobulin heavy chain junction region [Macaca mulatta]MOW24054.1 immunoglobulin heavy chain junction region [Macaca mulatta]